ncbi:uncharacterized protein LOC136085254 [Hydra vulgaris]|uniref:Uncharacterized protein LOC136085254 n=1 Tax=Hydra vulgaris TaxID=6087 RepID=A0ABM4CLF2_HYDVU
MNNSTTTKKDKICTLLNNYFQKVFAVEQDSSMPHFDLRTQIIGQFDENSIHEHEAEKKLKGLSENKAMGYDEKHPRVLKKCATSFAIPITIIYKKSISMGDVPDLWKKSNVTPAFKKGSKLQPSKYRPISHGKSHT